jgi:hypothetical protein
MGSTVAVTKLVSWIIIVKVERTEKGVLKARNFDGRYEQPIAISDEIEQMFGCRTTIFAEARVTGTQIVILRRARDRAW